MRAHPRELPAERNTRAMPGALFLDRDGVINIDTGYAHRPEEIEWVDGADKAIRWANKHGLRVVIVTNQAGIGRGYYTANDFVELTDWMLTELGASDAVVDAVYYCPHHPDDGCPCRKPEAGMLSEALREWCLDPKASLLIGDKESDLCLLYTSPSPRD